MEPPRKRLRLSPRHELEDPDAALEPATGQTRLKPVGLQPSNESPTVRESAPTKTFDIFDLRRRGIEYRNAGARLVPRVPDVTVTASVVNIAIMDGSNAISTTQITKPTEATEIPIANIGTLTIPGDAGGDSDQSGPSSTDSSGPSATGSLSSASSAGNGTSTDRTVTVTATSTLPVSLMNGTVILSSHHVSIFRGDGFTTTIDEDATTTDVQSNRVFATVVTPTGNTPSTTYDTRITATSSTSQASATNTGGGVVLTPEQQQMVGGVVGGVAGVAIVLLGILYFLKWYRQRLKKQGRLPEQLSRHRQLPSGDDHPFAPTSTMMNTSMSTASTIMPVMVLKQSLQKVRPHSTYTLASSTTERSSQPAPESERSFQRVSGRKIPSVLLTGGDGYGDHGPVSPISENFSYPRSREVSQMSPLRGVENSMYPTSIHTGAESVSGYNTPTRPPLSPFLDPVMDDQDDASSPLTGDSPPSRRLTSRSQLSIQTRGISNTNFSRLGDGNLMIKPSPARTPTTTSPTSSSLQLPMHTPPLMSGDIPAMPPLNPFQTAMSSRKFSDDGLSVQRSLGQRSTSAFSVRSSSSVGGKFKEDI